MLISTTSHPKTSIFKNNLLLQLYVCIFFCFWMWTLVSAKDINVWLLENVLLFMLIGGIVFTYRRYPLSDMSYILLITFLLLHLFGARYTYENNPLGLWLQELTDGPRNSYDRIVHFSFGLLLTYPLREIGLKYAKVSNTLSLIIAFVSITFLATFYEIIEWVVGGVFFPEQGADFVGLQGDYWDTQKDMFLAIIGSLLMIFIISAIKKSKIVLTSRF